jgi:hypothetical protein
MSYPRLVQLIVTAAATFGMAARAQVTSSESAAFLRKVAGVYKNQFHNSFVNGEKYESEDILEVVPVDDLAAYVRMDLEFANGHSGRIYGVATYKKNSLVYDNGKPGDERCIVEYVWSGDAVVTHADYEKTPGCLFYHGARGTLEGASFSVKKRQEIRYMDRLRNSREFKEALSGYRKPDGSNANPRPR